MKTAHKLLLMFSGAIAPPPAPTGLAITGASGGVVADLTPEGTCDAVAGAVSYDWEIATTGNLTGTPTVTGQTNAYTFAEQANITSYDIGVRAVNAVGPGPWSTVTVLVAYYLLRDEFTTTLVAGSVNGTAAEPGPGTRAVVDTNMVLSIAAGKLTKSGTGLGSNDPRLILDAQTRAAGLALVIKGITSTTARNLVGWVAASDHATFAALIEHYQGFVYDGAGPISFAETIWSRTSDDLAIVLDNTGARFLFNSGGVGGWRLLWRGVNNNTASLEVVLRDVSPTAVWTAEAARVAQLPAPLSPTLNVVSPTEQDYTGLADQEIDLTLTAPGSITEEAGIIYRKLDANNYWRAYFDTTGAFKVDSVLAGTPTNRISVAGVIAAGQTRTIRIRCSGSLHDAWTLATNTWTKRGAQVNVSHQNTQTTVQPDIGAGWTAANLISDPITSSQYDVLGLM